MTRRTSRRAFMGAMGAGSALAVLARRELAAESIADEERYWEMVRRQFSFSEDKVPMNAANLCPAPRHVTERVADLTREIDRDCSFNNRAQFADLREESRRKVAAHLNVSADEIALVRNTSEGNNIVNSGLELGPGDEVVIWDQNHPTNHVAWEVRAARYGFAVKKIATPANPADAEQLAEVFEKALSERTRVLAVTHVSNVSGIRLPVGRLCESAHRRGIHVHVDGAQSWGALRVDLRELACDSYTGSAHKWFIGPKEVGVLFVKADRIASLWPAGVAPGWGDDAETDLRGARKFESLGQRHDASLAALATAADFHGLIGPRRVEERVLELASRIKQGALDMGIQLVSPLQKELSGGVCILQVDRERRREVFNRLYAEHGIAGAATGGLRFSPHIYNTREPIERALAGVRKLVA